MSIALDQQIITDARDLIAPEHRWTQNWAITRGRDRIEPYHPRAKRFCAMGALERAAFNLIGDALLAGSLARTACRCLCPATDDAVYELEQINDRHGHAPVLKVFDDYLAFQQSSFTKLISL